MKKFSLNGYIDFLYAKGLSKKTIENYKFLLKHYIQWLENNFEKDEFLIITEKEKQEFINYLKNKGLNENSIKQVLKKAKDYTQFIGGKWHTISNIGTTKLDKKPYTKEELVKILDTLKQKNLIYYYLGIVLYAFGIKPEEIKKIKPESFSFENPIILNLEDRKVPAVILENHKKDLINFVQKRNVPKLKDYPLFVYYNDLKNKLIEINYKNTKVYFNNLSKEIGIEITFKRFRNTYIANLIQKDINLKTVAKWAGAKTLQSLIEYFEYVNVDEKKQLEKLK